MLNSQNSTTTTHKVKSVGALSPPTAQGNNYWADVSGLSNVPKRAQNDFGYARKKRSSLLPCSKLKYIRHKGTFLASRLLCLTLLCVQVFHSANVSRMPSPTHIAMMRLSTCLPETHKQVVKKSHLAILLGGHDLRSTLTCGDPLDVYGTGPIGV